MIPNRTLNGKGRKVYLSSTALAVGALWCAVGLLFWTGEGTSRRPAWQFSVPPVIWSMIWVIASWLL